MPIRLLAALAAVAPAPDGSLALALVSSAVTRSTARFVRRPRFTPKRFTPPPMPLAVATGSVTALTTPVPTFTNDSPAARAKTPAFDTSCNAAKAVSSCTRTATCETPSASKVPKGEVMVNTWYEPGVSTVSATA